jgi:transposase
MSLKSLPIPPAPEETARVAHAVFPRGNVFMQVRDTLGTIYTDEAFAVSVTETAQTHFC